MATGEGRYLPVVLWVVMLFSVGGHTVVASGNSTLVYRNTCPVPVFPSLIPTGHSLKINSSTSFGPIGPSEELPVPLPDEWSGFGFIRTGCILKGGGFHNCTTANCEGRDCTALDSLVATIFSISGDNYTISAQSGYNVGLTMVFMCDGCDCPSVRCKAQLDSCPNNLKVFNRSGAVAACKPLAGSELHFSEDDCVLPGDDSTLTPRITCPVRDLVTKIIISC